MINNRIKKIDMIEFVKNEEKLTILTISIKLLWCLIHLK